MASHDPFLDAPPAHASVLVIRFLLELALLSCVGVLAWQATSGGWRWLAATAAVVAVATVWWMLLSPKAPRPLPPAFAVLLEAVLFAGAGAGLATTGHQTAGVTLVVAWALHRVALALTKPRD